MVKRFHVAAGFAAALVGVHALWLIAGFGGDSAITSASDLIQAIAPILAMIGCISRARREPRDGGRRAWMLLAASQAAWALGAMIWSTYEVALRVDVPFPSLADIGFLSAVPLAAAGVLAFPGAPRGLYSRARTLLDGAIIGGSVLFISWVAVLGPSYRAGAGGLIQQILTLAYPLSDVVIVTSVVFVVARARRGNRTSLALVALGLLIYGLTDSTFIFLDLHGAYSTGSLIDVGWTLGPLLLFIGALTKPGSIRASDHNEVPGKALVFLPYFPAFLALSTAAWVALDTQKLEGFLVWNGLAVVLCLFMRQLMTLLENVSLNRGLESRVEARTAELSASEERFRSLVQNSSDLIAVISPETVLSYVSPAIEPRLGYSPAAVSGTELLRLVHEDDRPSLQASIAEAVNQPRSPVRVDCRVADRNGHWANLEIVMTNLLLDPSVQGIVINARDVTERTRLEDQLSHQAFHDPLTGLPNRALFRDRVEHALRRSQRLSEPLAVMFLDLDGFKAVNDSAGHAAGDQLLKMFGERLVMWARPGDTVARLGGDEFAILLEGLVEPREAESIARRVSEKARSAYELEGREMFVGVSIGIAVRVDHNVSADLMLRNADVAMYIAKARGKGRYEVFHPDMHAPILARLEIETELRGAIENGELRVYYQPIVEFPSGRVAALEALVRWEHPTRGLVPPDAFIPVAEESGLIHRLGEIVLNEACDGLRSLQPSLEGPVHIAVNLSASQFVSPQLPALVAATLARSGLAPELLVLEITETTVMADTEATVQRLKALKKLGVRLAIDDFGTGYSSLSYLRRFPVDILKIDRSFVRNIDGSPEESALAQAILKLAQTFKLEAVAEGIERQEQMSVLEEMGCKFGQGFYFARPQPLELLKPYLSQHSIPSH